MQAAGVRVLGGPVEELELADPPEPGEGEVLIDVVAAGIGNWEDPVRTGAWDVGIRPPMALGAMVAGSSPSRVIHRRASGASRSGT